MRRFAICLAGLSGCFVLAPSLFAQLGDLNAHGGKPRSYVVFAEEQQVVAAGKRSVVELRFKVADGFHVNSHTPKSELLIPTKLALQPAAGVKAEPLLYPAGSSYSFTFSPAEKLDVYSGAFTVELPVVAEAGGHTIDGSLHYQACDHAACYPPKDLPVQVVFVAK
ncbi:MAG: protein-disulfide reductase DsbD N-terminal domain-containing protein [Acidobacteriota bacterium]|nr:protein-disulfide reductase DsbD N-terminal domain-containing protein [Acidobacteriota bacterium]